MGKRAFGAEVYGIIDQLLCYLVFGLLNSNQTGQTLRDVIDHRDVPQTRMQVVCSCSTFNLNYLELSVDE